MTKKKQSPGRNADTQFMNRVWRQTEQQKLQRSNDIRERERKARARALEALTGVLDKVGL